MKKIVLSVASSGVAALLLPGGRTAHSRFKIPLNIDETTVCEMKRGSMLADLVIAASLIIWGEALMTHRKCFEALDRTFQDILAPINPNAESLVFGGKVVVLGGDLRQILPVIEGGSRSDVVNASITNSPLWAQVTILKLTINMRLLSPRLYEELQMEVKKFSEWILNLGEGKLQVPAEKHDGESDATWIEVPPDLLIQTDGEKIPAIVSSVYTNFIHNYSNPTYLCDRAVLTPTNESANEVNSYVMSLVPTQGKQYLSCDTIAKTTDTPDTVDLLYPIEFLNSITANNFPHHDITLKVGVPIMLLQNLSQSEGLCNGTRLIVTSLGSSVIEAVIMTGMNIENIVFSTMSSLTVRELDPKSRRVALHARVSRMWDHHGGTNDGALRHGGLVLIDIEGTAIYAEIPKEAAPAKKPLFAEGKVYTISRFRVSETKPIFKPVDYPQMIYLTCHTIATEEPQFFNNFLHLMYRLTRLCDLNRLLGQNENIIDVLGLITELTDLETVHLSNQTVPTVRRMITIKDATNYTASLYLWGQRASDFNANEILAKGQTERVTILFVATIVKPFNDEGYTYTVVISRVKPAQNCWFASCNRCSKACRQYGNGYKCPIDSCTGFRFKFKISLTATDGTDEADFICFGNVAQQLKYTFAINVSEKALVSQDRCYEIKAIVASHGRQPTIPHAPPRPTAYLELPGSSSSGPSAQQEFPLLTGAETDNANTLTPSKNTPSTPPPIPTLRSTQAARELTSAPSAPRPRSAISAIGAATASAASASRAAPAASRSAQPLPSTPRRDAVTAPAASASASASASEPAWDGRLCLPRRGRAGHLRRGRRARIRASVGRRL
ncbi:hypothetical protein ACP4OV_012923 [Aristida adscensionis]